jgi:hypothetical protein
MPGVTSTTTNPDASQQGNDIGSGGGTSTGGGTIVIAAGSPPNTYQYDVVSIADFTGHAYISFVGSVISCHSSVAVFNRNAAFSAASNSTGKMSNCVSYAAQAGFNSTNTSSLGIQNCVSSLAASNYNASASSSIDAAYSASVFPVLYGVNVNQNSSWNCTEFETMTSVWSTANFAPVPTHFKSSQNSYCENTSYSLSSKNTTGVTGAIIDTKPISFIWSQIWRDPGTGLGYSNTTTNYNILATLSASYRYVPLSHCVDYSNIIQGTVTDTSQLSSTGLLSVIAKGRAGYASVKPPSWLFPPEDNSGKVGAAGITGSFSISDLITST